MPDGPMPFPSPLQSRSSTSWLSGLFWVVDVSVGRYLRTYIRTEYTEYGVDNCEYFVCVCRYTYRDEGLKVETWRQRRAGGAGEKVGASSAAAKLLPQAAGSLAGSCKLRS